MSRPKAIKAAKAEKTKARLPRILKADDRVKRTFVISHDLDVRISTAAKQRGIDRSDLVEHLLAAELAGVRLGADDGPAVRVAQAG